MDQIIINPFADRNFKTAIFRSYISEHFPICFLIPSAKPKIENKTSSILKTIYKSESINTFKQELHETNWSDTETYLNPNNAYKIFFEKIPVLYDKYFPIKRIKLKVKNLELTRITSGKTF